MEVKKTQLTDNIFIIKFANERDVSKTFLRFQEHYESPEFAGKIFSQKEFRKWYKAKHGKFNYHKVWYDGFNIPSHILKKFYSGEFNPLTKKEKIILELFREHVHNYYIIAVHDKKDKSILHHEIAHALFFTDNNYKKEILKILKKYDLKEISTVLHEVDGYGKEVIIDEVQAYSAALHDMVNVKFPEELLREIKEVFGRYLKKMPVD